jgi:peptidoglycan/xylan/chitin deacetylase (PgdA/CDA1 family)
MVEEYQSVPYPDILHGRNEYYSFTSGELREKRPPDFAYSTLNKRGQLYAPIVDNEHLRAGGERPNWPGDADFAVCLTHDMDDVSAHSPRQTLRRRLRFARFKLQNDHAEEYLDDSGLGPALKSIVGAVVYATRDATQTGRDPVHQYERWLDLESKYDATSTFFVLPQTWDRIHPSDPDYRYDDSIVFDEERCTVEEMVSTIDSCGWEIGLHPTWYAYDDPVLLKQQRSELEEIIEGEVQSVRQHYLHYDPRRTPKAHADAGFDFDATLGFNRNIGFRRGSSYIWQAKDIEADEPLDIHEVPMAIQDVALFRDRALGLDSETAMDYIMLLADRVKETGGVLTLSWHPSTVANDEYFDVYKRALQRLDRMGAWFGSVKEVGEWWREEGVEHLI